MPENRQVKIAQPIGKVVEVKPDGTCLVELNLSNPDAQAILIAGLMGGGDAATEVLKRLQARNAN
jgi:hypothetical protein